MASILETSAVPYGITLTVWGSGALLAHFRGGPQVSDAFLFVFGGVAAYSAGVFWATRAIRRSGPSSPSPHMAVTGLLHWISIGLALGAVTLIARIGSWVAWPLGGIAGIGLYLSLVGIEHLLSPRIPLARTGAAREPGDRR